MRLSQALEKMRLTKRGYQMAFPPEVVEDLSTFCRAYTTTRMPNEDRDQMLINEGRRQVWMHIQRYRNLTPEELVKQVYTLAVNQGDE